MSADWYFMKSGWFGRSKRVGPLTDQDLIAKIERGDIKPETLMRSETKTRGRWIRMTEVGPAFQKWQTLHGQGG
jgi:hypothetical protein